MIMRKQRSTVPAFQDGIDKQLFNPNPAGDLA